MTADGLSDIEHGEATQRAWKEGYEASFRWNDVELLRTSFRGVRDERDALREQLDAIRVWLASPQTPMNRLRGIEHVLNDPEYAAQIAAKQETA